MRSSRHSGAGSALGADDGTVTHVLPVAVPTVPVRASHAKAWGYSGRIVQKFAVYKNGAMAGESMINTTKRSALIMLAPAHGERGSVRSGRVGRVGSPQSRQVFVPGTVSALPRRKPAYPALRAHPAQAQPVQPPQPLEPVCLRHLSASGASRRPRQRRRSRAGRCWSDGQN